MTISNTLVRFFDGTYFLNLKAVKTAINSATIRKAASLYQICVMWLKAYGTIVLESKDSRGFRSKRKARMLIANRIVFFLKTNWYVLSIIFTILLSGVLAKLHSFAKLWLSVGSCGFANVCNARW